MTIHAYEQMKQTLGEILEVFPFEKRELSEEEIEEKMRNGCGKSGYGSWFFQDRKHTTVSAIEYCFSNGLFFLDSEIQYLDRIGNARTIRQFTLTSNYEESPIFNLVLKRKLMSYRQLLAKTEPKDSLFLLSEKEVEIEEIHIGVNETCGDIFTTYKDLKTGSLLKEEYQQGYAVLNTNLPSYRLLQLCGCLARNLEIIYSREGDTPIYAQLTDKYQVEHANLSSSDSEDVKQIVGLVQQEVLAIRDLMKTLVEEYLEKQHQIQKTIGKNPNAN